VKKEYYANRQHAYARMSLPTSCHEDQSFILLHPNIIYVIKLTVSMHFCKVVCRKKFSCSSLLALQMAHHKCYSSTRARTVQSKLHVSGSRHLSHTYSVLDSSNRCPTELFSRSEMMKGVQSTVFCMWKMFKLVAAQLGATPGCIPMGCDSNAALG
jgi:hypothetical protein